MAGHSKWHNIQHRKKAQDKKRGNLFTKLIREIVIAAKMGGGDPDANFRLRTAIDKAFSYNMPKDTVERAIKRGSGEDEGSDMQEVTYEGYGINGVAVLVFCLTDNKNRTVADVRHAFAKCGGNLGTDGSVAYLFNKQGLISFPPDSDEEKIMAVAIEVGAEDIITNDDQSIDVFTDPETLTTIREKMVQAKLQPEGAEITMIPSITVPIDDEETASQLIKLSDMLEELDDVQQVYTNADIPDQYLNTL